MGARASAQVVINVSDPAGLQSAINTAPAGAIIQVASGTYPAPSGGFRITNPGASLTIRAASGATVVLDGQNARDILRFINSSLGSGKPVTFEGLTFANGLSATSGIGGGITMSRAVGTFVDCVFQNNATSRGGGGALIAAGSVAHFLRTAWNGNRAYQFGGGLAVEDAGTDVTIHDSRFIGNRTNLPGHSANAAGGGIHVWNGTAGTVKLHVTNTRFEANQAGYVGGALYVLGSWQSPLSTPTADVTVADCIFLNNISKRDAGAPPGPPTEGGAFHAEDQATARIYNSRFVTNSADNGGAVTVYRAIVQIDTSAFRGNRAVGTANSATGLGGSISAVSNDINDASTNGGTINRRTSNLTVTDSVFQGRFGGGTTTGQNGGCLFVGGDLNRLYGLNGVSANGSAATNRAGVTISGSIFNDCDVVQTQPSTGRGGAIFVDLVTLNLSGSVITNSDALAGSTTGGYTAGGGIEIIDQSSATISNSTLAKNTAGCYGGGILAQGTTVTVDGCRLVKNGVTGASACGSGLGATMFSGPIPGGGVIPDLPVSGEVRNSVITESTGAAVTIYDDDRSNNANLINTIVYNNNQIRNDSTSNIYRDGAIAGFHTVASLNSLIVTRAVGGNTDKSPDSNNTAPGSNPIVGQIVAAPPNRLSTAAPLESVPTSSFLGYGWGGAAGATVNGNARSGNAGFELVTLDGLQSLTVSSSTFNTIAGTAAAPSATLVANPPGIVAGDSSQLTWGVSGTFLLTSIDQGVGTSTSSSGVATVTPAGTTTYRHFGLTEEGGSVAAATVHVCSTIVVDPWAIPAAIAGSAYSQAFTQTGGSGTIGWSRSGALPAGMSFNTSTAILSGTTAATGNFPFTLTATDAFGCQGSRDYILTVGPAGPFEAMGLDVDAGGNLVLEPGEVASMSPAWRNTSGAAQFLTGALTDFGGPGEPDPSYSIPDGAAGYGTVGSGATNACASATGNCYSLQVSVPTSRPATHWDALARETLSDGQIKDWFIHVGGSFSDVPRTNPFYRFVETLLHRSVTAGCSATNYCPTQPTTRAQMAVFVLRAKEGSSYAPAACGGSPMFGDVPVSSAFCPWIEELARRGVVNGCGGGNYCPDTAVSRDQMAVFVLRTLDPSLSPPACTTPMFADVAATNPYCRWIEELARRHVVTGCSAGNYCPVSPVDRQQMGVFIGKGFDLSLYGP